MTSNSLSVCKLFTNFDSGQSGQYFNYGNKEVYQYSQSCPSREGNNEDSAGLFVLGNGSLILAIADGMGGMPCASQASAIAIQSLQQFLETSGKDNIGSREAILSAIDSANSSISSLKVGAGSTIAVAEFPKEHELKTYHVGDSEILVCGQRGKIKLQTISHAPVSYGVESGFIEESDALYHDERHLISNYLGLPEMRIELGNGLTLAQRDTVVVGSDGLFDNLQTEEIVEIIRKQSLNLAGESLIDLVNQRMNNHEPGQPSKMDDVSFFLCRQIP